MSTRTALPRLRSVCLLACALVAGACADDPPAAARKFTQRADAYVAKQQYKEAIIEYRNALKATPDAADIRYKLGRAYEDSGDPVKAYGEFARAADLDPSNVEAQMRAGTLLLVAREFEAARTRAELALKANPSHVPAHILLGNALAGLNETAPALRQIEQAISLDPSYAPAWTALGAVTFVGGRKAEAAAAFEKAVQLSPRSIDARLALANYQWASAAVDQAEGTLEAALEIEPQNAAAHRALALLYLTTRRAPQAEPHFKALAVDAAGRLALADYYMGIGRNADAVAVLKEVAQSTEKNDVRGARLRLAAISYAGGRKDEAHGILDQILKERPRYAEGRIAKARMLLSDGAPAADALTHAREAVKADPNLASAHYTLGLAALENRDLDEAEQAFEEVTRLTPRAVAAQTQLARIRMARGDAAAAVSAAERAAREQPKDVQAAVLLAQTLRAQGNVERAASELTRRLAERPDSPALHLEMGWLSLQRREPAVARASFHEALRAAPASYDAKTGIVAAELAAKNVAGARTQVAAWRAAAPGDTRLQILAARVELAAGDIAAAEQLLKQVIEKDAAQLEAYELLGGALASQGRIDDAIRQYEALAKRAPRTAAGARTMIGMLHERRGDGAAAKAAYEQVLVSDPRAGIAANNLAWIFAQEGKLDEALRMATVARESLRRRPEAEDTLGWIYLQKGMATQAIASFERARERAPQNPVYHYHLGLAHLKNGDRDRARTALTRAIELRPEFPGAADARTQLATLDDTK